MDRDEYIRRHIHCIPAGPEIEAYKRSPEFCEWLGGNRFRRLRNNEIFTVVTHCAHPTDPHCTMDPTAEDLAGIAGKQRGRPRKDKPEEAEIPEAVPEAREPVSEAPEQSQPATEASEKPKRKGGGKRGRRRREVAEEIPLNTAEVPDSSKKLDEAWERLMQRTRGSN